MRFKQKINTHKINVKEVTEETLANADKILEYLCFTFNMKIDLIKSKSRKREVMIVRRYFCYLAYKHLPIQLAEVAKKINLVDHTTVIHHRDTVEDLMETDSRIRLQVFNLDKEIKELLR